jgi:N-acetylmuramoyl-L-alanine amidase
MEFLKSKTIKLIFSTLGIIVFSTLILVAIVSWQNTITPSGIVIHHSAIPYIIEKPEDISIISEIHKNRGFSIFYWGQFYYIGYHYVILPNGEVVKGRPDKCRGSHTKGHNDQIGICLIGDFSKANSEPTDQQIITLIELTKSLQNQYSIPFNKVSRHHDLNSETECPGNNFPLGKLYYW